MAIKPGGSTLTINGNSVIVDDVVVSQEHQLFQRLEYSNNRIRTAKNSDGSSPIFIPLLGGRIVQLAATCGGSQSIRPLSPDSADSILKRFNITKYTLRGGSSLAINVNNLVTLAAAHQKLLARFEAHIQKAQMDISYTDLIALQAETFSYLTASGISMSGNALQGTVTNILVTQFTAPVEYEVPTPATVLKSWSAVIETRTIENASAT